MITPPYDDQKYLRVYRAISRSFLETDIKDRLLEAEDPGEIIYIFDTYLGLP